MEQKIIAVKRLSPRSSEQRQEWREIRDLCCRTANAGAPIATERWPLFGRIWIGPYERIVPQWTYAAVAEDTVVGYLTGCPDTRRFARGRFWKSSLPLVVEILSGSYARSADRNNFVRQFFRLAKTPEESFPAEFREELATRYPAHLHINVEASFRSQGIGARLIEIFFSDLRNAGVAGVHLYCGAGPVSFYRKCGFEELMTIDVREASVYALGVRLASPVPDPRP
ncbi:MAG TPA: GNAT family N-acetyltransferase [Candidatus Binatia bacterium]